MAGNTNSFKNKAHSIEDGDNNDIRLTNVHLTSPKCTYQLLIQQRHIMLKKGKHIGQVIELEECTENINATKNYDLSDNNLQCGQPLNSDEKEH